MLWVEVWVFGAVLTALQYSLVQGWRKWQRFFADHHSGAQEPLTPLPVTELDLAFGALHHTDNPAAAADPLLEQLMGLYAAWEEGRDGLQDDAEDDGTSSSSNSWTTASDDNHDSDSDESESASDGSSDDGDWAGGNNDDDGDEGDAAGEGAARKPPTASNWRKGQVAQRFRSIDKWLLTSGGVLVFIRTSVLRAIVGCAVAVVTRSRWGILALAVAWWVAAVVLRRRFPRKRLCNPRRRFDEVVARTLHDSSQVSAGQMRLWYATFVTQMALLSFVMPMLAGMTLHYGTAPYFVSLLPSFDDFLSSLTMIHLVAYWFAGSLCATILMLLESSVISPVFAPGVDLFYTRSVDLQFEVGRVYYEIVLAQIFDMDLLAIMYEFVRITIVELGALLFFLALPVWVSFSAREYLFADLSAGRIQLPLPLYNSNSGATEDDAPRGGILAMFSWTERELTQAIAVGGGSPLAEFHTRCVDGSEGDDGGTGGAVAAGTIVTGNAAGPVRAAAPPVAAKNDSAGGATPPDGPEDSPVSRARFGRPDAPVLTVPGAPGAVTLLDWLATVAVIQGDAGAFDDVAAYRAGTEGPGVLLKAGGQLVGRAGGHCAATLAYAALHAPLSPPVIGVRGETNGTFVPHHVNSQLRLPPHPTSGSKCVAPQSAVMLDYAHSRGIESLPSYLSHSGCVATFYGSVLSRLPLLRRLSGAVMHLILRSPGLVTAQQNAQAVLLFITVCGCLVSFPLQYTQLRLLRPLSLRLSRLVGLEKFLFDQDRLARLDGYLAAGGADQFVPERIPVQYLVLWRGRHFHPSELPSWLTLRLIVFSVLLLVTGSLLFWVCPVIALVIVLALQQVTTLHAIGLAGFAVFLLWDVSLALMCLVMSPACTIFGVAYIAFDAVMSAVRVIPSNLVLETWLYAARAEKTLRVQP